jgi:hypothetical protein
VIVAAEHAPDRAGERGEDLGAGVREHRARCMREEDAGAEAATRRPFSHWSAANSGTITSGTPAASAPITDPWPPWQTIASACASTYSCETQRSTCTCAASGVPARGCGTRFAIVGAVVQGALGAVAEQRRVGGGVVVPAAAALL